jgi:hypothetical protein
VNDIVARIPDIDPRDARLPARYEAARVALVECQRLDECQDWADRAAALASYARQADDDELEKMCQRIRSRAIRRCGELLQAIPVANGANQNIQDGAVPKVTRESAATDAGLTERQRKTALRVASVPEDEFEALVEAADPPSASQLAERGTRHRLPPGVPDYLRGRAPEDFQQATQLLGLIGEIPRLAPRINLAAGIRGLEPQERERALDLIDQSMAWLGEVLDGLQ